MISVCVLSFNRRDLLAQTLKSMVDTADEPLEIIVHDDGSTEEGLREWLYALAQEGMISHLVLNPRGHNEGQGIAVNRMFHAANGDILVKCDQDLIFKPGWSKEVSEVMEANRQHDLAALEPRIGALGIFKYKVEPVRYEDMFLARRGEYPNGTAKPWDEVKDFVGSFMAIPREAWEKFGPWEERSAAFAEDAIFKQRVADTDGWCCALTSEDYATNVGFGPGPSTVVKQGEKGIEVEKIKTGPWLVEGTLG